MPPACQVYPTEYSYDTQLIKRPRGENCTWLLSDSEYSSRFRNCTHPNILTDSTISQNERTSYVSIRNGSQSLRILFTFSSHVALTDITLFYDSNTSGINYSLPNLTFLAMSAHFEIWDEINESNIVANVSAIPPGQEQQGLRNKTIQITSNNSIMIKKILIYMDFATYNFSLREVEFFSDCGKLLFVIEKQARWKG